MKPNPDPLRFSVALTTHAGFANQAQPRFVDQSRGLQRLSRGFSSQLVRGEPAQFPI